MVCSKRIMLAMRLFLCVGLITILVSGAAAKPSIMQIASQVETAAPLSELDVLYAVQTQNSEDEKFYIYNVRTAESTPWPLAWSYLNDGWDGAGPVLSLAVSPSGRWVCFAQCVWLEDEHAIEQLLFGSADAVAVVLCSMDGNWAKCVALSHLVGSGPQYDFTTDSRRIVGQPWIRCEPDAQHYVEYASKAWEIPPVERYNYIRVPSGERGWQDDLEVWDGYWKCPYSDNFRIENNWYAVHRFSNFQTAEVLGEYETPDGRDCLLSGWVLQDALLTTPGENQGLLYVDGTLNPAAEPSWEVYCWLPDGTYVFSNDAGKSISYGKVDWPSFTVDWWVERRDLAPYVHHQWSPLPDSSGIILLEPATGALHYTAVSRTGAKP